MNKRINFLPRELIKSLQVLRMCKDRCLVIFFLCLSVFFVSYVQAAPLAYPTLYLKMSLPEYPGASVVSIGHSSDSLDDGISIVLETTATHAELRHFYENRMAELGWKLQETIAVTKMREAGVLNKMPFMGNFCRNDGVAFLVSSTNNANKRQVNVTVTAKSAACLTN